MRQCRPISPHISPYLRRGRLDATVRTPPNTPSRETSAPRAPPPSPRTSWPHLLPQLTRTRLQSRFPSLPISAPISPYLAVTLCARAAPASSQRRPRPTPPPGESRRISANLGESRRISAGQSPATPPPLSARSRSSRRCAVRRSTTPRRVADAAALRGVSWRRDLSGGPRVVGGPCQRGDPHAARRGVCGAGASHTSRRHVRYASPP